MPSQSIETPFSQRIYDKKSDQIHNVRVLEKDSGSRKNRRKFHYTLFIGYKDPIVMDLEILPRNEESLKELVAYCIQTRTIELAQEAARYKEVIELVSRINHLLNDHLEEIPEADVTTDHRYKVTGSWFQGSFSTCRLTFRRYLTSHKNLLEELEEFSKIFKERHDGTFVKTTREEIDTMNGLLREVKEQLKLEFDLDDDL